MSKKLIAVAAAAALALSALVAAPASATGFSVNLAGNDGTGQSATTAGAAKVSVPTLDVLRFDSTASNSTVIKFTVATTTTTGAVAASSTGAVKLITQAELDDSDSDSKTGATSLSAAAPGNSEVVFYAFTTSTTPGTVKITNAGNSVEYFVTGKAGKAYTMTLTGGGNVTKGVDYTFSATVVDMFGNPVTGIANVEFSAKGLGAFAATPNITRVSAATGIYNMKVPTAESGSGILEITLASSEYATLKEASFGKLVQSGILSVNSVDPSVQITALTAQVAALQAVVAKRVTKKRFNTLARKWNAANPSSKVKLKK